MNRGTAAALLLVLSTMAVFSPGVWSVFLPFDDGPYVLENPAVRDGLGREGLRWAFGSFHASNWHPLTWLSHMADVSLFGLDPRGHHLTSILLHSLSAGFLLLVLRGMSGASGKGAAAAALFALHPLRVESVAWVAERKDVLAALFWILGMAAYLCWLRRPGAVRYLLLLAAFALGLMAKPVLVTFPLALLLLDWWPLGRWRGEDRRRQAFLLLEKGPLLIMSGLAVLVTLRAQESGGALLDPAYYRFPLRLANALVACVAYLRKTILPLDLALFYPLPRDLAPWKWAGAGLTIVLLSSLAVVLRRRAPWFGFGWFWFAGTLVPVSGLVQVGVQGMADRYTYIPHVGLAVAAVWGGAALAGSRAGRHAGAAAAVAVPLVLAALTIRQLGFWRDSVVLLRRALQAGGESFVIRNNLGLALAAEGRDAEAAAEFRRALELEPAALYAYNNLGILLGRGGRYREAADCFREAIRLYPPFAEAHSNLGIALEAMGRREEALESYRAALRIDPGNVRARTNLSLALSASQGSGR